MRQVKPVVRHRATGARFALCDFVFVMRENQINAAGMKIECFTEIFTAHCRAFQVPAGTALPPRTFPEILTVIVSSRFPQNKIRCAFFVVFIISHTAGAGTQLAFIEMRKFAVPIKRTNFEIDGTILCRVGVTFTDEIFNHRDLMRNVLNRTGLNMRLQQIQLFAIFVKLVAMLISEFFERFPVCLRIANRLVVQISQIAHV